MIISEQWLRDWISVDLSAHQIADCLTNAGLEVDGVTPVSEPIDNLVVGRVLDVSEHPDADRLNLTKVDIGSEQLDIVCGAANVRAGMLVAVATVGAKLPNGLKIKKAKVRGAVSNGMLCSASELGLEEASEGILELAEDAEIGQRVDDYLQLNDKLIDIDLTPNRGDCLSVQGVARELRVLADATYHPLDIKPVQSDVEDTISVVLNDAENCPCYLARVVKDVDCQASTPLWMRERLRRAGVRPISAVVDIANYVMLELGQPMHAFDLAKLHETIVVRQSETGESIALLDDSNATLDGNTLVIADSSGPVAIAGVMGGGDSAISDTTLDIVLEAAHFTRKSAAGTARRYGLHTESSHRFERGVDPMLPPIAIERATELVLEICGGRPGPVSKSSSVSELPLKPAVDIRLDRLTSLLGMPLEHKEVSDILKRISDNVVETDNAWSVTPPSYRFDIEREADLVEEVARVKGYDNIPTSLPRIAPRSVAGSEQSISTRQLRQAMVARDYREAITYSFIDPQSQSRFDQEVPVNLANPLAENMAVMRTSLIPGLMSALQFNVNRQHDRVRLFEIGASYHKQADGYKEIQRFAGVVYGPVAAPQWGIEKTQNVDFFDVKADLEAVLSLTGHTNPIIFSALEHVALHPGQQSQLIRKTDDGEAIEIGWLGRLHPTNEKHYGVGNVIAFELNLDKALSAQLPVFTSVSRFPAVKRDLSVVVDENVPVASLIEAVQRKLDGVLTSIDLFSVYRGDSIADDAKSVSFSMILQHVDKTMTDEESEKLMGEALAELESEFSATLRS